MFYNIARYLICVVFMLTVPAVQASEGFSLALSRVIISHERSSSVQNGTVTVNNDQATPALIHAYVTTGPNSTNNAKTFIPFIAVPPLFRMEPRSKNILRLITGDTSRLPHDRESVFYLHVLDIPPENNAEQPGRSVSIALAQVIKVFYRPPGLPIPSGDALRQLSFNKADHMLFVVNNSPYYVTFESLRYRGIPVMFTGNSSSMVAPFSSTGYPLPPHQSIKEDVSATKPVEFRVIDDFGGHSPLFRK